MIREEEISPLHRTLRIKPLLQGAEWHVHCVVIVVINTKQKIKLIFMCSTFKNPYYLISTDSYLIQLIWISEVFNTYHNHVKINQDIPFKIYRIYQKKNNNNKVWWLKNNMNNVKKSLKFLIWLHYALSWVFAITPQHEPLLQKDTLF